MFTLLYAIFFSLTFPIFYPFFLGILPLITKTLALFILTGLAVFVSIVFFDYNSSSNISYILKFILLIAFISSSLLSLYSWFYSITFYDSHAVWACLSVLGVLTCFICLPDETWYNPFYHLLISFYVFICINIVVDTYINFSSFCYFPYLTYSFWFGFTMASGTGSFHVLLFYFLPALLSFSPLFSLLFFSLWFLFYDNLINSFAIGFLSLSFLLVSASLLSFCFVDCCSLLQLQTTAGTLSFDVPSSLIVLSNTEEASSTSSDSPSSGWNVVPVEDNNTTCELLDVVDSATGRIGHLVYPPLGATSDFNGSVYNTLNISAELESQADRLAKNDLSSYVVFGYRFHANRALVFFHPMTGVRSSNIVSNEFIDNMSSDEKRFFSPFFFHCSESVQRVHVSILYSLFSEASYFRVGIYETCNDSGQNKIIPFLITSPNLSSVVPHTPFDNLHNLSLNPGRYFYYMVVNFRAPYVPEPACPFPTLFDLTINTCLKHGVDWSHLPSIINARAASSRFH